MVNAAPMLTPVSFNNDDGGKKWTHSFVLIAQMGCNFWNGAKDEIRRMKNRVKILQNRKRWLKCPINS
jgi:hypothetical protein